MGWEIIFAMAVATAIARGYERSKRRARASWEQAQEQARQRAELQQKEAERRRQATRRWLAQSRRNPRHPVAWGYGIGWGLAATVGAMVAGVRGARDGAVVGAREGARLGRTAARDAWTWRAIWREWRAQRAAENAQRDRINQHAGTTCGTCGQDDPTRLVRLSGGDVRCVACLAADAFQAWRRRTDDNPPSDRACRVCGTRDPHRVILFDPDGTAECVTCLRRRRDEDHHRTRTGEPPPVMVRCLGCGVVITAARAEVAGGVCADCDKPSEPPPKSDFGGDGPARQDDGDVHDAVIVDPPELEPPNPSSGTEGDLMPSIFDANRSNEDTPLERYMGAVKRMVYTDMLGNRSAADASEETARAAWEQMDPAARREAETFNSEIKAAIPAERQRVAEQQREWYGPQNDRATRPGTPTHRQEGTIMSGSQNVIQMNGSNLSGGDGEGYVSTIALLTQVGQLLDHVDGVMNDLGDTIASKHVDNTTIQGVSDVEDNLQAASNRCGELLKHVQAKHEEVAVAVAGAGGSTEVADTDWYDNY